MSLAFRAGTIALDAAGMPLVVVKDAHNVMIYDPADPSAVRVGVLFCSVRTGELRHVPAEELEHLQPATGKGSFKRRTSRGKPRVQAFTR